MRLAWMLAALVPCAALPARADKRLDQAVAKAEQQLARGKPDEAVKVLEKAAAQARRDPEAQLALARLLTKLGRLEDAGTALARAGEMAKAAPPAVQARVYVERSTFDLRAGTVGDALDHARAAVSAAGGAESLAVLARAQARAGDPAARETASRAVAAGPRLTAAQLAHGDALLGAGLGKDAEAAYRRALELDPRSVAAHAGLALALAAQGQTSAALEAGRAATRADPASAEAQAALGLATLAQDPLDKAGEAVAAVQQASFLDPRSALAKVAVGRVFESRGQLPQGGTAYEEAVALDPTWGVPRIGRLRVQGREGDASGALARFRILPDEFKLSGEADLLLGQLLSRTQDPMGARVAFARAAAALPGRAEAHAALGAAAYDVGDLTLAADSLGRAATIEPANLDHRLRYGLYLAYDGRLDEGVAVLLEVTGRPEGQTLEALLGLGRAYRAFKPPRVAEAVAAYERALKLDPRNAEAALGMARSYRDGRQWARAADAYERIPALQPRLEGEAMLGAAWCFHRSGDDYRARFYTGLAARAGADVRGLRAALSGSSRSAGDERAELATGLDSTSAGDQVRAVRALVGLGRTAVPTLSGALGRPGSSLAAREAIVEGLGRMGPAARDALAQLDRLIEKGPRGPASPASFADDEIQEREAKLVRAMESAVASIRGK